MIDKIQREKEEGKEGEAGERLVWVIVDGFLLYWCQVRVLPLFYLGEEDGRAKEWEARREG